MAEEDKKNGGKVSDSPEACALTSIVPIRARRLSHTKYALPVNFLNNWR